AEAVETETRATNRNTEPAESELRPDLVWDNEAPGFPRKRDFAAASKGRMNLIFLFKSIVDEQFGYDPNSEYKRWVRSLYRLADPKNSQ
ncbi:MAG: hypothetical protein WB607_26420, partial [Candidatus Acidiferrum sp.]